VKDSAIRAIDEGQLARVLDLSLTTYLDFN